MATESLSLKWGTLKGWNVQPGSEAHRLIEKYHEEPTSISAMAQRDTESQKALILEIIDAVDAEEIYLDWDGRYVGKQEAREYITGYGD